MINLSTVPVVHFHFYARDAMLYSAVSAVIRCLSVSVTSLSFVATLVDRLAYTAYPTHTPQDYGSIQDRGSFDSGWRCSAAASAASAFCGSWCCIGRRRAAADNRIRVFLL